MSESSNPLKNRVLAIFLMIALAACSGDDGGRSCNLNLDDTTVTASTDWPSARRDPRNSARLEGVQVSNPPQVTCIFPRSSTDEECRNDGSPITTVPIIGPETLAPDVTEDETMGDGGMGPRIIVVTEDGAIHVLDETGVELPLATPIDLVRSTTSPLAGENGSIFVADAAGRVLQFDNQGELIFSRALGNQITADPILGPDGVAYIGSIAGSIEGSGNFEGVCTNGVPRSIVTLGSVSTNAAVTPDPNDSERTLVIAASDSGRVQAIDDEFGRLRWSFFTAGRLSNTSIVLDERRGIFAIADTGGNVVFGSLANGHAVQANGDEVGAGGTPLAYNVGARIATSPALGRDHIYVVSEESADQEALLHALPLPASNATAWTWSFPNDVVINSSPVVAAGQSTRDETVVAAADFACESGECSQSMVVAVRDGSGIWIVDLPASVGFASPSIRKDGDENAVIFVGTQGGQLFEIR